MGMKTPACTAVCGCYKQTDCKDDSIQQDTCRTTMMHRTARMVRVRGSIYFLKSIYAIRVESGAPQVLYYKKQKQKFGPRPFRRPGRTHPPRVRPVGISSCLYLLFVKHGHLRLLLHTSGRAKWPSGSENCRALRNASMRSFRSSSL